MSLLSESKSESKKLNTTVLIAVIIFLLILLSTLGSIGLILGQPLKLANNIDLGSESKSKKFIVHKGESAKVIINHLSQQNIISSYQNRALIFLNKSFGFGRAMQKGEYEFLPTDTVYNLLIKLVTGKVKQYKFTVIEGLSVFEIAPEYSNVIPEGYLLPQTYFYTNNTPKLDILNQAAHAMRDFLDKAWNERDIENTKQLKNMHEVLVLASILEKETSIVAERALMSGVFLKRLALRMPLQADPTIIYAKFLTCHNDDDKPDLVCSKNLLSRHDLRFESGYNTYLNKGLPPTPICCPSKESVLAVLHPIMDKDYLYFVADGSGGHVFSKTLSEHNKIIQNLKKRAKNNK